MGTLRRSIAALASLIGATLLAFGLERWIGVENASAVYLLAVAIVALVSGTQWAIVNAVGGFLAYNFLFVEPRFSLAVERPEALLTLVLLLVIGVIIGQLTSLGRERAQEAARREREARALFAISGHLAAARRAEDALQAIAASIAAETDMDRIWIGLGATPAHERIVADTGTGTPPTSSQAVVLRRDGPGARARWTRVHEPGRRVPKGFAAGEIFRVDLNVGDEHFGSLYGQRSRRAGEPPVETTRLLGVAADQIAQALQRDRLARRALDIEVTERSDAAKSALLDLVSHELRTPLAAIRASAGSLADADANLSDEDREALARAIDAEAIRLNRLVGNLLDMSRLEAGRVTADIEVIPVQDALEGVIDRMRPVLDGRPLEATMAPDLPPIRADATFLEQILGNLLDNAARYSPPGTPIHVTASGVERGMVEVCVEDAGSGVPDDELERIFERFYRRGGGGHKPPGTGLGLPLVRGLTEAMGGQVTARRNGLGGLTVSLRLPAAAQVQ